MGITIFAWGRIDRIEDIGRLIEDVKGIAEQNNWTYRIIDDGFAARPNAVLTRSARDDKAAVIKGSLGLKGIIINPEPGSEPLSILFDRSGVLTDLMQQLSWIHSNGQGERFTMCKTQFAGIDTHIQMIELLANLKERYIANLTVNDEGAYWETRDRRILAEKRVALGHYLRHVERVLGNIEPSGDETQNPEALADRIEQALLKAEHPFAGDKRGEKGNQQEGDGREDGA
ncbi:MAG TPA: hypothetical protein VIX18_00240 [Nitrospirota bacterium]